MAAKNSKGRKNRMKTDNQKERVFHHLKDDLPPAKTPPIEQFIIKRWRRPRRGTAGFFATFGPHGTLRKVCRML
jgi:hypothetical protein